VNFIRALFSRPQPEELPESVKRYLEHVLAEYAALPDKNKIPPNIKTILDKANASPPATMTRSDLFVLEKTMLLLQAESIVRRRVWGLRCSYKDLVGPQQYAAYLASKPPDETAKIDDVRADCDRLIDGMHWNYALLPVLERVRNGLVRDTGSWTGLSGALLLVLAYAFAINSEPLLGTLMLVMLAGEVGGFFSFQRRLQGDPSSSDPLVTIFALQNGWLSMFLSPVSGAVFAVVLYFVFQGQILAGTIFPSVPALKLTIAGKTWGEMDSMSGVNYGMLLVWSFVAGFAERLVPDTLDRLVNRAQQQQGTTTTTIITSTSSPPGPGSPP
jgi:hypothetical protein